MKSEKKEKVTVTFTSGRMHDLTFFAKSAEDARKMAFAEYRRNITGMDFSKPEDVISQVVLDPDARVNYSHCAEMI